MLTQQLVVITKPDPISLLPSSLNTTNTILASVLDVLETEGNNTAEANEVRVGILDIDIVGKGAYYTIVCGPN